MSDNAKLDKRPSGMGVMELRIVNDIELELGLCNIPGAMTSLCMIADHGGELPWSDAHSHPNTNAVVNRLVTMGLFEKIDRAVHHLHGRTYLRLTDKGRNVVGIHKSRKVEIGGVRDVSVEEARTMEKSPPIADGSQGSPTVDPKPASNSQGE
jgi:hypothetical protein